MITGQIGEVAVYRSIKCRLYPSKTVQIRLDKHREICRWLYNRLLEEIRLAWDEGRKIYQRETQALIVELKKEKPELKNVHSKVLQMVNHRLWSNLRSCFALERKGFPVGQLRFKSRNQFKTLCYNQSGFKIDSKECRLILSKIGQLPIRLHRQIMGQVKGVLVKKYASGKWFAILQVETENTKPAPRRGKAIGLDVGLTHFITDSEGRQIENPRFYEKSLQRIKLLHRKLSRKVKGSKNWEKNRLLLARVYEKLLNRRNDFLHKLSHFYTNNYDIIAVEDLQIQNMVRNRTLSQKILDASWAKFFTLLSFKAESAGRLVVKVDPKGTSQTYQFGELDRDYNAALNVYHRGLGRPYQPVKRGPLRHISAQAVIVGQVLAMNQEAPQI